MSSEIKSKTKQLGIKAKTLNDLKLNVKNMVPSEIYDLWKDFVLSFENRVKNNSKMRVGLNMRK